VRCASSLCAILAALATFFTVILLMSGLDNRRGALIAGFGVAIAILLWFAASYLRRRRRGGAIFAAFGLAGFAVPLMLEPMTPSIRYGFLAIEAVAVLSLGLSWRHLRAKAVGA
jgi:hypothetical protein